MIAPDRIRAARILVVDDEPANVAVLEAVLRREGYGAVESVTDPARAVKRRLAFDPDLVVLDLMMPGIDGYALLDALRRVQPRHAFLPVLVLTADTTIEAKRRALSLGARDIVTKPFDVFELGLRIANLIELRILYQEWRGRSKGRPLGDEVE